MKFMYFAQPQGQLLNDMQKAIREMDREDIPLPEITAQGKAVIEKLQKMTQEELAEDLYFVETFTRTNVVPTYKTFRKISRTVTKRFPVIWNRVII